MSQKFTAPVRRGLDYVCKVITNHVNDGHVIKLKANDRRDLDQAITWLKENAAQSRDKGAGGGTDAPQAEASA